MNTWDGGKNDEESGHRTHILRQILSLNIHKTSLLEFTPNITMLKLQKCRHMGEVTKFDHYFPCMALMIFKTMLVFMKDKMFPWLQNSVEFAQGGIRTVGMRERLYRIGFFEVLDAT